METKLEKKYVIGTHVMWFEIEMYADFIGGIVNLLETVDNKENVIIDLCFNMLQHFEKVDNDSFAAWHFGELQVLDLIQDQFDGVKKSFTLKSNSVPVTIRASDGSNIDVQSTLLVFLNDILQVPGEGFTLVGGSTLTFPSAPKGPIDTGFGGDTCKVLFYKGSGGVDVFLKMFLKQ